MKDPSTPRIDAAATPLDLSPRPPLTLQEQSDQIAELVLASARRLANDPECLARIKKLLF
jgi:type IV pilus biogenesis protein CpaD/CtpE